MKTCTPHWHSLPLALALACASTLSAQTPGNPPPDNDRPPPERGLGRPGDGFEFDGPPPFGPGGFGPGGPPPFGPGGPMQQETKLVKQFDQDGDQRLNNAERKAARDFITQQRGSRGPGGPGRRRGGFGGPGETEAPPQPGAKLSPAEVKTYPAASTYDPQTLRTFFLEFENADWEKELSDFNNTDVEVPAKLTVDGKTYAEVGVHFRGASSLMMVGEGRKRSLNLSLDDVHESQQLGGYRTFNLLNAHEDPTLLRTILYYHIAREYLPAPKANFVRVVINGESWGVYVSAQQFNKDFAKDWFGTSKGARWKVPGSPGGRAGLNYLGDDPGPYKRLYEIKSKDDAESWADFIRLCKVLNQTPTNELEQALAPLLDTDGALKFLALENALINNDGYWVRASDYSIYQDTKGRFHLLPYDANETFAGAGGPGFGPGPGFGGGPGGRGPDRRGSGMERGPGGWDEGRGPMRGRPEDRSPGPGFGGGPRGGGVELDPLVAASDSSKPLLSKLLAVPALRARYLGYVRDIAEKWLDWNRLGPLVQQYQAVIAAAVKADTRKLYSTEAFLKGVAEDTPAAAEPGGFGRGQPISLKAFAEKRRAFLLKAAEAVKPGS